MPLGVDKNSAAASLQQLADSHYSLAGLWKTLGDGDRVRREIELGDFYRDRAQEELRAGELGLPVRDGLQDSG